MKNNDKTRNIKIFKELNICTDYANRITTMFDVYEKSDGNYKEYVIKKSSYTDVSLDADGNEIYVYNGSPSDYMIIPELTYMKVSSTFELINDDTAFSWIEELIEV